MVIYWWFVVVCGSLWPFAGGLWSFVVVCGHCSLWSFAGDLWSFAGGLWSLPVLVIMIT